jgi:hypothetical protein
LVQQLEKLADDERAVVGRAVRLLGELMSDT